MLVSYPRSPGVEAAKRAITPFRGQFPQETELGSGDHRPQDTAQSDAQSLPIIVVGPTDSDHLPACISEILVAHDPVTFCLFEFIARLAKFRDSVELNDDVEILDQEVDIVVIPVNTDVDLRVNCEGTDRTNDP